MKVLAVALFLAGGVVTQAVPREAPPIVSMNETTPAQPPSRTPLSSENFLLAGFALESSLKRRDQGQGHALEENR